MGCRIAIGFGFNVLFKAILYAPLEANTPLKGIHHCFTDLFIIEWKNLNSYLNFQNFLIVQMVVKSEKWINQLKFIQFLQATSAQGYVPSR